MGLSLIGVSCQAALKAFDGEIAHGDVYILSDPCEAGGNHLPDWTIVRPVFVGGKLTAFCCNRAHQSDIGGGAAGTYNAAATEIFHEGIRLPVLRLVEGGKLRRDLWHLLLLNSRCPDLLDGDLRAMVGSTEIGAKRTGEVFANSSHDVSSKLAGILDHAERLMRSALTQLKPGSYEGEDESDNDCFGPADIRVHVRMTLSEQGIEADFTGSSPQIRGFKKLLAREHPFVGLSCGPGVSRRKAAEERTAPFGPSRCGRRREQSSTFDRPRSCERLHLTRADAPDVDRRSPEWRSFAGAS